LKRGWMLALVMLGSSAAAWAQPGMYRCQQAEGGVSFQELPCATAAPAARAAIIPSSGSTTSPKPKPAVPERSVSTPAPVAVPAPAAATEGAHGEHAFVKPTKRKRDVLDLSAQFERCRADAPGFAEKSAVIYAAWTRRHADVLMEHQPLLMAKVRAGRRGESTLPLRQCTDDWLRAIEPLSRTPDPRLQTVEKTWQLFLGALMTGDRATVQNCLAGRAATRWQERAAKMSDDDMRRIGASVRALKVQWGDDYEKEGVIADTDNRVVGVAFRNLNEEWKITDWGGAAVPMVTPSPAPVVRE
jgi:hypothetical protein